MCTSLPCIHNLAGYFTQGRRLAPRPPGSPRLAYGALAYRCVSVLSLFHGTGAPFCTW